MKIMLPDNSVKEYNGLVTGQEVALSISEGLAANAVAVKIDGGLKLLTAIVLWKL